MKNLIKITLSLTLLTTLNQAKVYEDSEDGNTQGWRIFDNTPSGATISNIEDNGNRVIKLSGDITRNAYIIGGTSKVSDKPNKWDEREGSKLSFKIKFDEGQRPEILVAIRPAHQSDKIRYIRYRSATRHDENGWNRSGSILSIKLDETLENGKWLSITRDIEKDLQAYRHPFDPTQNTLIAINGMIIYGSALVDDIKIEGEDTTEHQLLTLTEPLVPSNCKGEIVKKGLDLNDNGVLEENEVTSTNENYTEGTPITRSQLEEMIRNNEDYSGVNTCKITDMSHLFERAGFMKYRIGNWNTGNVRDMSWMFSESALNQNLNDWNVSNVINMEGMFFYTEYFNGEIGQWDVSNVRNMRRMFDSSYGFNTPLGEWNVSNVRDMRNMFASTIRFDQDISAWDLSSVTKIDNMFYQARAFNHCIKNWNLANVENLNLNLRYINTNGEKSYVHDQDSWDEYILSCPTPSCIDHPISDYVVSRRGNTLLEFSDHCSAYLLKYDDSDYISLEYLSFNPESGELETINTETNDAYGYADLRGYSIFFQDNEKRLIIKALQHDYARGDDRPIYLSMGYYFIYDISDPKNPRLVDQHPALDL